MNRMSLKRTSTYFYSDAAAWTRPDGLRIFVKVAKAADAARQRSLVYRAKRERTCLRLLSGLAVPRVVRLGKAFPLPSGIKRAVVVARTFLGECSIQDLRLSVAERVGLWAFVVEQLAAFRAHGVIYTDIKCDNLVGQRSPLGVWFIDFEAASGLAPKGAPFDNFGTTWGYEAPEVRRGETPREPSVVYSAALLLFQLLTKLLPPGLHLSQSTRKAAFQALRGAKAGALVALLGASLSDDAKERPRNFQDLLAKLRASSLPDEALRTWRSLRAPYAKRLTALGMKAP